MKRYLQDAAAYLVGIALLMSPVLYAAWLPERKLDPARLEIVPPMQRAEFGKADPARIAEIVPAVKILGCIFAEHAVRHHVRPEPVALSSCGGRDVRIAMSDDLIDITVDGIATFGKTNRRFKVTLQHNPPSVTYDGLIVTGIEIAD